MEVFFPACQNTDTLLHLFFRIFAILCLTLSWAGTANAFAVNDIRFGTHPDKIRMVVELSEAQPFRAHTSADPWRMIIDLPGFQWNVGNISRPQNAAITSIRQGVLQPGVSRIIIDFQHPVMISSAFILPRDPAAGKPDRLVIDFARTDEAAYKRQPNKTFGKLQVPGEPALVQAQEPLTDALPSPAQTAVSEKQTGNVVTASMPLPVPETSAPIPERKPDRNEPVKSRISDKKYVIVIDAGHGGVDPGALGANGIYEKQVTLSMAKTLKEELEKTGRYKVLLTREKDTYLKLYKRVEFARNNHADMFISLHADSIGKSNVHGASIYTLSEKASDEQTALLADRENRADLIAGMDLNTSDEQVATILVDLTMRDTMNQSKFFANKLVSHLEKGQVNMLDNPHRFAGFAVLKAPDIPSVLIEMGFMSNPREAAQLNKPEYRRTLARSLTGGINAYFDKLQQMQRS